MAKRKQPESLRAALPGLGRTASRLRGYISKQWALVAGGLGAMFVEVLLRLLEPWPLKLVFDRVIQSEPQAATNQLERWASSMEPGTLLVIAASALIGLTALRAGAAYISTVTFALAGNRVLTDVRAELYRHLQRLSLSYHTKARGGDLVTRITGDVGRLQEVAVTAALPLVGNVVTLIGMVGVMLWLDWQLALIAMSAFPLFALNMVRLTKRIKTVSTKQRRLEGEMASVASESFGAIKVVQAYSLEKTLERSFASSNRKSLKDGVKAKKLSAGLERKTDVLVALGVGLVVLFGAYRVLAGLLSPGDLIVFMTYVKSAFKPMRDMAKYTGRLSKAAASGERVVDILDTVPEIRDHPHARQAPMLRGAVEMRGLSFSYEPGHPVLSDLNLRVRPGQRVALVGPSGAGKSSVASLLLRLYDPDEGVLAFDGVDIRDYKLASIRSQVAAVLQESVLFAVSVRENIAYGLPDASEAEIVEAAMLANAHEFIHALPDGYDTVVGERGATLSGGQRQRIAIARAALRSAPIIVLDEPTTGLDRSNEAAVSDALDRLTAGRTTFLIAHDLETVRDADVLVFLQGGRVVEQGTHDELMRAGGRYAAMYQLQRQIEGVTTLFDEEPQNAADTPDDAEAAAPERRPDVVAG